MFSYDREGDSIPIKVWMDEQSYYADSKMMVQVENTSRLPFAFNHIAIMSDGHMGYGVPIGSVLATINTLVVAAIGVDIGCGMLAMKLEGVSEIDTDTLKLIMGKIREEIPVGFNRRAKGISLQDLNLESPIKSIIQKEWTTASISMGTLGGGNHFIEIQKGSDNNLWVMIHSGSRNLGKTVADYHNKIAVDLNEKWHSTVPKSAELAFLPIDTEEGQSYLNDMNFCVKYAQLNRCDMMERIETIFRDMNLIKEKPSYLESIHNYATLEETCPNCIDNQDNDSQIVESLLGDEKVSKAQDSLDGYRPFVHSCGGLLLLKGASVLKFSPSQIDALEQMSYVFYSLIQGFELKHNHFSSLRLCECESFSETDSTLSSSENKFGLGFGHLFGVEKEYHKWDRVLGRVFLGYVAYNLNHKIVNKYTSSISQKHGPVQVWVHRKGAVRARKGDICIIPGSQGTKSYICTGLGNIHSFQSCSHGAGRKMGRNEAKKTLNLEAEQKLLNDQGIIHGIRSVQDLDEAAGAYKDISWVMDQQKDLVKIEVELTPMCVIKG